MDEAVHRELFARVCSYVTGEWAEPITKSINDHEMEMEFRCGDECIYVEIKNRLIHHHFPESRTRATNFYLKLVVLGLRAIMGESSREPVIFMGKDVPETLQSIGKNIVDTEKRYVVLQELVSDALTAMSDIMAQHNRTINERLIQYSDEMTAIKLQFVEDHPSGHRGKELLPGDNISSGSEMESDFFG